MQRIVARVLRSEETKAAVLSLIAKSNEASQTSPLAVQAGTADLATADQNNDDSDVEARPKTED